jgi:hypothetical protein
MPPFTNFERQDRTGDRSGFEGLCVFGGFQTDLVFFRQTYDRGDGFAPQLMPNPLDRFKSARHAVEQQFSRKSCWQIDTTKHLEKGRRLFLSRWSLRRNVSCHDSAKQTRLWIHFEASRIPEISAMGSCFSALAPHFRWQIAIRKFSKYGSSRFESDFEPSNPSTDSGQALEPLNRSEAIAESTSSAGPTRGLRPSVFSKRNISWHTAFHVFITSNN